MSEDHGGQDLADDDARAALAAHPGRFEEVPVAQGQGSGAQLVGAVGPAGEDEDGEDDG